MTSTASLSAKPRSRRRARPAMTVKWLAVLASLTVATVLDGISISNLAAPNDGAAIEQAAITLPADRCAPGCAIMMASNLPEGQVR